MSQTAQHHILLRTTVAAVLTLGALTTGALARPQISITSDGFGTTPIKVVSENGTSWTKIEDSDIGLSVNIDIAKSDATVYSYQVRQTGQPEGNYILRKTYDLKDMPYRVDYQGILVGSTTHMTAAQRNQIIAQCNKQLSKGKGIHETHNILGGADVELLAYFVANGPGSIADASGVGPGEKGVGNISVPITCVGKPATPGGYTSEQPKFSVKGIHLRFMTSAGYPHKPDLATRCQLTQAKVRVETSVAGPVKFKLWTKVGSEPMQSQVVDTWSNMVGPGKFEASFIKPFHVTKTTTVQAMAEDMTNPIGQSSGWKSATPKCTSVGGGFASKPSNTPDASPKAQQRPPRRVLEAVGELDDGPRFTPRPRFIGPGTFVGPARPHFPAAPVGLRPQPRFR